MSPLHVLLLIVALLPMAHFLPGWRRQRPASAGRRWPAMVRGHWLRFALPAVLLLGVTGQLAAFWRLPAAFAPAAAAVGLDGIAARDAWSVLAPAAIGVGVGVLAGVLLTAWRAWRGWPEGTLFGDASSIRPRRGELGWAAAVAVTAGVTEEAYFRLLLPLLATRAFGNGPAAFAGATLLFGLAHRYQGWRGVAATTVAGAALAAGYLATGNLAAMMVFHAIGDLSHLVLRPTVRGWIERWRMRRQGGAGRPAR